MVDTTRLEKSFAHLVGDANLRSAVQNWLRWLRDERRLSPHTVDAYVRDLSGFLTFMAGHLKGPLKLGGLAALAARDFRAWLDRRSRIALQRT